MQEVHADVPPYRDVVTAKKAISKGGTPHCNTIFVFFFFLTNCWSSVVASVVSPQLCNNHFFFQITQSSNPFFYGTLPGQKRANK